MIYKIYIFFSLNWVDDDWCNDLSSFWKNTEAFLLEQIYPLSINEFNHNGERTLTD